MVPKYWTCRECLSLCRGEICLDAPCPVCQYANWYESYAQRRFVVMSYEQAEQFRAWLSKLRDGGAE